MRTLNLDATEEDHIQQMGIALNAGFIAQKMYTKLDEEFGVVTLKGVTNNRAVCRLQVKRIRKMVDPSTFTQENLQTLVGVLREFRKNLCQSWNSFS